MVDHTQSAIVGLKFLSNFELIGFVVSELLQFLILAFRLEIAYSRPFLFFGGTYPPSRGVVVNFDLGERFPRAKS